MRRRRVSDWNVLFQSLVRDSAHSDSGNTVVDVEYSRVSIPRSGFCPFRLLSNTFFKKARDKFQSLVRDSAHSDSSGSAVGAPIPGFNPSFGILPIQTNKKPYTSPVLPAFQSLVRDSAHSDCRDQAGMCRWCRGFNPSFGILPIQTGYVCVCVCMRISFNPSFGILPIQTPSQTEPKSPIHVPKCPSICTDRSNLSQFFVNY